MAPAPRKSSVSSPHPLSSLAPARPSLYTIPSPFAPPWCPSPDPEHHHHHHHEGHPPKRQPSRFSVRMPSEIPLYKPHWLSRLRSALRLLIIVLSGGVAVMLAHTLHIYRGNTYLDLRKGELPMTWPARTNLAPTLVLLCIANANFLASVAIMSVSFTKSFRRPIRSRDMYRIVAGSFGVVLWVTALVVFNLLGKASKASLGRYACMHRNVMSNGRYQYRAVCEEQGVAYYLAIGAASAEVLTLATLGVSALLSAKHKSPRRRYSDKKDSISFGVTGRFP